jgi:hypothetical protein
MPIGVAPRDYYNNNQNNHLIDPPDFCPQCHSHIEPRLQTAFIAQAGEVQLDYACRLEVVFACARRNCQQLFIARYKGVRDGSNIRWDYDASVPVTVQAKAFEKIVTDVSPQFAPIYNQAFQAEQLALDQICGPGYRKALEFLIKDYAKAKYPLATDEIEKKLLGACIAEYIDHPGVKSIAQRATWLAQVGKQGLTRPEKID